MGKLLFLRFVFEFYTLWFMFYSSLYYFSGYWLLVSKKQNTIVKIFQIHSFGIQISFTNDSIGHVIIACNLYFNIEKRHNILLSVSFSGEPR